MNPAIFQLKTNIKSKISRIKKFCFYFYCSNLHSDKFLDLASAMVTAVSPFELFKPRQFWS